MDRKIKVLALLTILMAATIGAAVVIAMQSTAKADPNSAASDVQQAVSSLNATCNNGFANGYMNFTGPYGIGGGFGGQGFGNQGFGGHGGFGGFGGFAGNFNGTGSIQVSSAFTQNVTDVLNSNTDVEALLSQGWNVTSISPVITTTINGNGNVVMQATSANVILQGTDGRAFVVVDLTTQTVTKLVTTTVINNPP